MPYSLRGTSVVKSDSGEVVKRHPTREKALAHLRALKANVEEGSPVLGALLEGVENELRDASGRWVHGATSERHGKFKIGDRVKYETGSRPAGGHGPVTFTTQPGVHEVVGFQRNGYLRVRHPDNGTTVDVHHSHASKVGPLHPEYRGAMVQQDYARDRAKIEADRAARAAPNPMSSSSRERGLASIEAGRRSDRPRIRPEDRAPNEQRSDEMASGPLHRPTEADMRRGREAAAGAQGVTDSLTAQGWTRDATGKLVPPADRSGVGPEGRAARDRGANSLTTEHADTRDKLTNLPMGQTYGLHGPRGQVGHVTRTANGWEVQGGQGSKSTHKTPSSAAGAAMRMQRKAASSAQQADVMARNYRAGAEVRAMDERQAKRAEEEAARQRRIGARRLAARDALGVPRVRESAPAPGVLGALLEGC